MGAGDMETERASLDEVLDSCLEAVESGQQTVEQVLARYPDQAEELRPLLETAFWFANHKAVVSPRPGFVRSSKHRLMDQINAGQAERDVPIGWFERIFGAVGVSRRLALQLAVVVVMLVGLIAGGNGIAYASQQALPGDRLYSVKLGLEQAELLVALDDAKEIRLHTQFSQLRLAEIQTLISDARYNDIDAALSNYQYHVSQASRMITQLAQQNPQAAKGLAGELEQLFAAQAVLINSMAANAPAAVQPELQRALVISESGQSAFNVVIITIFGTPTPTPTFYPTQDIGSAGTATPGGLGILDTPTPTAGSAITVTATTATTLTATPTFILSPTPTLGRSTPTATPVGHSNLEPTPTNPPTDTPEPPQATPKPTKEPKPTDQSPNPTRRPPKATPTP